MRLGTFGDIKYLVCEYFGHWVKVQSLGNNIEPKKVSVYSQTSHGLHFVLALDPGEEIKRALINEEQEQTTNVEIVIDKQE